MNVIILQFLVNITKKIIVYLSKIFFSNILMLSYHDKIDFIANWKNWRSSRVKVQTINVRTRTMSGRIRAAERFAFILPLTDHHKFATFVHEGWSSERMRERDRVRKREKGGSTGAELWNNTARTRTTRCIECARFNFAFFYIRRDAFGIQMNSI